MKPAGPTRKEGCRNYERPRVRGHVGSPNLITDLAVPTAFGSGTHVAAKHVFAITRFSEDRGRGGAAGGEGSGSAGVRGVLSAYKGSSPMNRATRILGDWRYARLVNENSWLRARGARHMHGDDDIERKYPSHLCKYLRNRATRLINAG